MNPNTAYIRRARKNGLPKIAPEPPKPLPYDKWPTWALAVAALRRAGEAGVGDTVARLATVPGFIIKTLGIPCRCQQRHELWNIIFNYITETA